MELQIDGQNVDIHDDLRTMITDRVEKLNTHHGDIIHARVSLVKSSHHQQGSDEVRIFLSMTRRKGCGRPRGARPLRRRWGMLLRR